MTNFHLWNIKRGYSAKCSCCSFSTFQITTRCCQKWNKNTIKLLHSPVWVGLVFQEVIHFWVYIFAILIPSKSKVCFPSHNLCKNPRANTCCFSLNSNVLWWIDSCPNADVCDCWYCIITTLVAMFFSWLTWATVLFFVFFSIETRDDTNLKIILNH